MWRCGGREAVAAAALKSTCARCVPERFPLWGVRCHAGISRQRNIRYPGTDRALGTGSRADALGRHDN